MKKIKFLLLVVVIIGLSLGFSKVFASGDLVEMWEILILLLLLTTTATTKDFEIIADVNVFDAKILSVSENKRDYKLGFDLVNRIAEMFNRRLNI